MRDYKLSRLRKEHFREPMHMKASKTRTRGKYFISSFFTKKREVYRKWSIKRRFSNKRCSQISAAAQIWFTNKRPTFVTALDIKRYQNHIAQDKQDPHPLVSSKILMYGNFRNQVHITFRGVHIYPFSCPTLSSLFIPLSVLPLVKISAAPLTRKVK